MNKVIAVSRSAVSAFALAGLAAVFCVGCGGYNSAKNPNGDDSYTYSGPVVTIGSQKWMAKNLDRATPNSKCYDNSAKKCAEYGRLYTWDDAKVACPAGWHLPSDDEWTTLIDFVGGREIAYNKLRAANGWSNDSKGNSGNGTDDFGFSALPGGFKVLDFCCIGSYGGWWSVTNDNVYANTWGVSIFGEKYVVMGRSGKMSLNSVRCVAD